MSKIKVKITGDDVKGSESGQEIIEYAKGEVYDLDEGLAKVLIDGDLAEPVDGPLENDDEDDAPESAFTSESAETAAAEAGLSAEDITGTGSGGKITVADVKAAVKARDEANEGEGTDAENGEGDSDTEGGDDAEGKAVENSPENKAVESADENKAE